MPEAIKDKATYFERLKRFFGNIYDPNFGPKEHNEAFNELKKYFTKWKLNKLAELYKPTPIGPSFLKDAQRNNQYICDITWDQYKAYATIDGEKYGIDAIIYQMLDDLKISSKKFNWHYSNFYESSATGDCILRGIMAETKANAAKYEGGQLNMSMTTQDMVALRKARAIIEDVAPRTAFGRSVNYIEDRFDGKKCVLGYYEASENLSPSEREEYIVEACNYLNNLNEHFHVDGYHFDMSGITEGKLYFAKDAEDFEDWTFNSSEGEYSYMEECAYRQYLVNKAEVQHKLQLMVNEAMIIVDEESDYASKLNQLMSIQEGVTDSISDAWTKFKNFLGKMWAKFTEFLSRTINSDKNYLDKYKDIILNKEFQLEGVEIDGEYKVGINRLSTYQVNTPNPKDIEGYPAENNAENLKMVQKKFFPEYNGSIEFSDFCKNYFKGSRDGKENRLQLTKANINMTDLFNYCYNYQKIHTTLGKNYGIMQKAGDSFIAMAKEMDKAGTQNVGGQGKATQDEINAANKNTSSTDTKTTPKKQPLPSKADIIARGKDDNAKKNLESLLQKYDSLNNSQKRNLISSANPQLSNQYNLNELEESVYISLGLPIEEAASLNEKATFSNGSSTGGTTGSKSSFSPNASAFGNATGAGNVRQHQGVNNVDANGTVTNSISKEDMADDAKGLTTKVNMYTSTASTVFAGMLQAAQTIQKDYMAIIKRHVQSYLGDKDSPDKAAMSATTNNPTDQNMAKPTQEMIDDLKGRAQRIQTIRNNNNLNPDQKNAQINAELQSATASVNNARAFQSEADITQYADQLQNVLNQQNKNTTEGNG